MFAPHVQLRVDFLDVMKQTWADHGNEGARVAFGELDGVWYVPSTLGTTQRPDADAPARNTRAQKKKKANKAAISAIPALEGTRETTKANTRVSRRMHPIVSFRSKKQTKGSMVDVRGGKVSESTQRHVDETHGTS